MGTTTKQQKTVPKLRFRSFSGEWLTSPLSKFITLTSGNAFSSDLFATAGNKLVTPKNFTKYGRGEFNEKNTKYTTEKCDDKYICKSGDLLVLLTDLTPSCELLGKPLMLNDKDGEVLLNQRIVKIETDNNLSKDFLLYVFLTDKFHKKIKETATGTTVRHSSNSIIKNYRVDLPSVTEQQKIADFLGCVDAWLDNLSQQKTALENYKRGMMQKLFTQQVRFKDENCTEFPRWQEKKLGDIEDDGDIKLGRGNVISKKDIVAKPGDYPIYSSSVKDNGLFGKYGRYMFDEELITWSVDGGGHFFYRPEHKFSITNVSGWMRVLNNSMVAKFLAYQLQYHHAKLVFDYSSKAHPSVIRGIYTVSLPSKQEQQKIADFLTTVDQSITAKAEEISKVEQWKKGLMQKMFI